MANEYSNRRCPNAEHCPLYPRFSVQAALDFWKRRYCADEYHHCKRYQMGEAGETPPEGMLPNGEILFEKE